MVGIDTSNSDLGKLKNCVRIGQSVNEADGGAMKEKVFDGDGTELGRSDWEDHRIENDRTLYEQSLRESDHLAHSPARSDNALDLSDDFVKMAHEVIVTNRVLVRQYCNDPRFRGRSILSWEERLFCDMRDRVLRPLCEDLAVGGCYNPVTNSIGLEASVMRAGIDSSDTPFTWSSVTIDEEGVVKRDQERVGNVIATYGSLTKDNNLCLPLDQYRIEQANATHYYGPLVEEPIPYQNLSGSIIFDRLNGSSVLVADCIGALEVTEAYSAVLNEGERIGISVWLPILAVGWLLLARSR